MKPINALKRLRLAKGDVLVIHPRLDPRVVLAATTRLANARPELRGMPIIRADPYDIMAIRRAWVERG